MSRCLPILALVCAVSCAAAAPVVIVNGDPVELTVTDVDGKAMVDIVALMELLGGKATYDAAAGKLFINSAAPRGPVALADFGTAELPGEWGQIGQVYKLRTASPLLFRLNSLEYSVAQLRFGTTMVIPAAAEKLLVLHFSVQNPQDREILFRSDQLKFTIVDEMNVNHEAKANVGDEQTHNELNLDLKPAQRVDGYVCFVVPAKGSVPKLMVLPNKADDGPIVRYDLRHQVTSLPAPVADPADATGATALEIVAGAALNTPHPLRYFDVSVEGIQFVTEALDAAPPPAGGRYGVVTLACTNKLPGKAMLRNGTLTATLTNPDGQQMKLQNVLLAATGNTSFGQDIAPGETARVRVYFTIPAGQKAKTLGIKEASSRTYTFTVADE